MSKHTPGPWIAQSHSRTHYVTTASPDEPELIADVYPGGTESADADANARLIAAAPELLDVLTQIRDKFAAAEWSTPEHAEHLLMRLIDDTWQDLRAALAKAGAR